MPLSDERLAEIRAANALLKSDLGHRPSNPAPWYMLQGRSEELVTTFRRAAIDLRDLLAAYDEQRAEVERLTRDRDEWQRADSESVDLGARYRQRAFDAEAEVERLRAQVAAVDALLHTEGVARHPSKTVRVGEIRAALASEVQDAG